MQPASIINGGDEGRAAPTPAAPTPVPSALPSRIGKYDVRGEIGKGTLVKVFRAQDTDIGRPVILKILAGSRDRRLIELFRREVMAAARLRHRNLITIYELGEHAGMPFAAMQDPEGCELRTSMAPGALTLLQKAGIMSQVAEGLQTAHQGGLAYVGVRPSGILLTGDRSVLIQDFSIVRLITEEQDEDVSYAAPEELKNGALPDALCDIFSFGVIYYELLAGVHPFRNGAPPALREAAPDCPEALERIIHRAMEPSRERRYQSVEQLLDDAEPILCELKRTRAAALLVDARRMQRSGEIEQAQGIVREMLELDPANRKAREMQAALRAEQQRRILEERLRTLFKEADEEAAARRFARAVEILHTAAQLEGAPPEAARRLDDMCARLERSQNAAELLAEARRKPPRRGRWIRAVPSSPIFRPPSPPRPSDAKVSRKRGRCSPKRVSRKP
jgi:serine/threonine-protein kinase